jgi:hypothetical protein
MKRAFYFDDIERDLLRCALSVWYEESSNGSLSRAHRTCVHFTGRRLKEMIERLREPEPAKVEA